MKILFSTNLLVRCFFFPPITATEITLTNNYVNKQLRLPEELILF